MSSTAGDVCFRGTSGRQR